MTAKRIASAKRIAVITIGLDAWLMPEEQALKVYAAMSGAVPVKAEYSGGGTKWLIGEPHPADRVEMRSVKPSDVVQRPDPLMIEQRRR